MIVVIDTKLLNLASKRNDAIEKANQQCITKALALLPKYFEKYKTKNLTYIGIVGYTPEFNDGEECLHTTYVYIENDIESREYVYSNLLEFMERLDDDIDFDNLTDEQQMYNKGISRSDASKLESKIQEEVKEILEEVLGTNWVLRIEFTDEGVTVDFDEYECGY